MNAASSGPTAEPALPPTWKTDCASPCRPPEAIRATREDSGWNIDDPSPISAAASSMHPEARRDREQQQPGQRRGPCRAAANRAAAAVRVQPDDRLQERRRELEGQRDQPDLAEIEREALLQDRIDRRQQRLHQVVEEVADADRREHGEGRPLMARGKNNRRARLGLG